MEKPDAPVLYSWCFTNVNENDATLRVLADGRVTVEGSELVEIPWPVMQALLAHYSRPVVQALVPHYSSDRLREAATRAREWLLATGDPSWATEELGVALEDTSEVPDGAGPR